MGVNTKRRWTDCKGVEPIGSIRSTPTWCRPWKLIGLRTVYIVHILRHSFQLLIPTIRFYYMLKGSKDQKLFSCVQCRGCKRPLRQPEYVLAANGALHHSRAASIDAGWVKIGSSHEAETLDIYFRRNRFFLKIFWNEKSLYLSSSWAAFPRFSITSWG